MTDNLNDGQIIITEEMIERGLEFFENTNISFVAAETSYPEFVLDLLNYAVLGQAPWRNEEEKAADTVVPFEMH